MFFFHFFNLFNFFSTCPFFSQLCPFFFTFFKFFQFVYWVCLGHPHTLSQNDGITFVRHVWAERGAEKRAKMGKVFFFVRSHFWSDQIRRPWQSERIHCVYMYSKYTATAFRPFGRPSSIWSAERKARKFNFSANYAPPTDTRARAATAKHGTMLNKPAKKCNLFRHMWAAPQRNAWLFAQ